MGKGLFVTGTGTDVGKTFVAALLVKKLHASGRGAAYYKAAMSGNARDAAGRLVPGDAAHVRAVSGIAQPLAEMCPYVYEAAVSPHLAARLEGGPVELGRVLDGYRALADRYDYITMEGSGGILCPLRCDGQLLLLEDVVGALGLPCLVVADAGLGTINGVVLTCEYLRRRGLRASGIIFNRFHPGDAMEEDNRAMCARLTGTPVIAAVAEGATDIDLAPAALAALYQEARAR